MKQEYSLLILSGALVAPKLFHNCVPFRIWLLVGKGVDIQGEIGRHVGSIGLEKKQVNIAHFLKLRARGELGPKRPINFN